MEVGETSILNFIGKAVDATLDAPNNRINVIITGEGGDSLWTEGTGGSFVYPTDNLDVVIGAEDSAPVGTEVLRAVGPARIEGFLELKEMVAPALSGANDNRIYFDSTTNLTNLSEAGGSYRAIAKGFRFAIPIPNFEAGTAGTPSTIQRNSHLLVRMSKGDSIVLKGRLADNYDSTKDLFVDVNGISQSATTGDVVIGLEFDSLNTQDFDANTFAAAVAVTIAASGTSGVIFTATFTLTNANVDSTPAGGLFRCQLTRQNVGGDTMTGGWEGVDMVLRQ